MRYMLSLPSTFALFYLENQLFVFYYILQLFFLTTLGRDFMQFLNAEEIVQLQNPSVILAG